MKDLQLFVAHSSLSIMLLDIVILNPICFIYRFFSTKMIHISPNSVVIGTFHWGLPIPWPLKPIGILPDQIRASAP